MKPPPAKNKHRSALGGPDISRTSTQSDTDNSGIKILSSPMAMAELEEENRRLKQMAETMRASKSVRRWSNEVNGLEESRRLSQMSNDSMVESDVATGNEKRVTFERPNSSDIENHTEMDAVDEEGGVIEEEENIGEEASHIEMNVVDAEEGVDEEDIEKEEQVDNIVKVV